MKLSVSAYRAHASAHKKILSSSYQSQLNYGSTAASSSTPTGLFTMEPTEGTSSSGSQQQQLQQHGGIDTDTNNSGGHNVLSPTGTVISTSETQKDDEDDSSNAPSSDCKSPSQRTKSNQRWMKLRTTVQISSAIQKKPPLKREDSFLKRFSTRQIPETQETVEDTGSESASGDQDKTAKRRRRYLQKRRSVVNPDENFYFYWLMVLTFSILYNLWTLIVRQSFPELQTIASRFWFVCDCMTDIVFALDIAVQLRTGYLEQGLMVYDDRKLACHYMRSRKFLLDLAALIPLDLLQLRLGPQPLLRFPRFLKVYRSIKFYYIVESRTVWPNLWRVVNLIHILLILAHWFGCFYFLLSEAEGFQGDWVYPYRPGDYATLTRKYLGSLYWSTLTLTTIGDLPTPETNAEPSNSADGPRSLPRRGLKSRLLQFASNYGYIFTIVSYLIGVFIFATIVGQVGNVITNRNANRLEFERLLDGAKTYMRHHKVPGGMKRRVLRWYDYSWSRGRIQGGGDINTALGLLPDKLKTELALHVNLSVLKKVTIFQECQPEFLHDLVLKMKAYIFTPGDSICRKGEVAREMFIIADGILEVLSETGKVLTTMKAGDFFGEIGILNLDGLNKRTADVRSVGYSELFSLSREDVLAAMKDYPEAQEILQTLGRKRLMEVRCVNKKQAKAASEKAERLHQQHLAQVENSAENSASKRIVDKFRSDVRGFKSVLRKSRRSNESLEMQPLHTSISSNTSRSSKGMLRRMPRVRSDDFHQDQDDHVEGKDKTPSPIGAGLPLLQRLRLLKEKQDREERAVKSAPPLKSPPNTHITSAVSPQESIQEEPEQEVIGAGLPLLQRLHLLKAKEERIARDNQSKSSLTPAPPSANKIPMFPARSPTSPTAKSQLSPTLMQPGASGSGINPSSVTKPKVSFRDRIREMQQETRSIAEKENETANLREKLIPTISSKFSSKPSTSTSFKEKFKNFGHSQKESSESLKPWSKLKLATVVSTGSYSSLSSCQFGGEGSPQNDPNKTITPTTLTQKPQQSIGDSKTKNEQTGSDSTSKTITSMDTLQIQNEKQVPTTSHTTTKSATAATTSLNGAARHKHKPKPFQLSRKPKCYRSVDDLSPEYSGLPFVKKLKILNERQKLAELESVIQTRSFSLDCTESGNAATDLMEPLFRSHSDASGISTSVTRTRALSAAGIMTSDATSLTTSTTIDVGGVGSDVSLPQGGVMSLTLPKNVLTSSRIVPVAPLNMPQCLRSPLSPESNETMERRQLKSILKKLNENKTMNIATAIGGSDNNNLNNINIISSSCSSSNLFNNNNINNNGSSTIQLVPSTAVTVTTTTPTTSPPTSAVSPTMGSYGSTVPFTGQQNQQPQKPHLGNLKDFKGLLNAPTVEGYVARHSKFSKSVTFNSTLSSPPSSGNTCSSLDERSRFTFQTIPATPRDDISPTTAPIFSATPIDYSQVDATAISISSPTSITPTGVVTTTTTTTSTGMAATIQMPDDDRIVDTNEINNGKSFDSSDLSNRTLIATYDGTGTIIIPTTTVVTTTTNGSPISKYDEYNINNKHDSYIAQKKLIKGSLDDQEYFSEVLLGIKHVIQTHMIDIHSKFQDRFTNLELEVKRRDEIINELQNKIVELEEVQQQSSSESRSTLNPGCVNRMNSPGTGSSGSSGELPFMRGDSIDTIFSSSPPTNPFEKPSTKSKNKRRVSPRHRVPKKQKSSDQESSDQESIECMHPLSGYRGIMVSDVTGNLTRLSSESVIVDIEDSSSTSSASSPSNLEEEEDPDEADERADQLHCDDWEVRMLAAELDRRESRQRTCASSETLDLDENGQLLRRRRKQSDTDTECSEIDVDVPSRPRAASLDQYNLRHEKCKGGVFKAMSFDRDKDRL